MKLIFYTACLLLVLSGSSQWQALALQVVELARQQLPQHIADFFPTQPGVVYRKETGPGLEGTLSARLEDALRTLRESGDLHNARVTVNEVRFVAPPLAGKVTNRARRSEETPMKTNVPGYYVAYVNYDLISPLTMESGVNLVAAAYALGIAEVRLSDGYGMVKTFQMPQLRN
jgi:hypothetical protein